MMNTMNDGMGAMSDGNGNYKPGPGLLCRPFPSSLAGFAHYPLSLLVNS